MKKVFFLLVIGLIYTVNIVVAQNHHLKFMVLPFNIYIESAYYTTLSYEYQISPHHSLGIKARSSFHFPSFLEKYRFAQDADIYYHYNFLSIKKVKPFIGVEIAYVHLRNGGEDDSYYSDNYSVGPKLGFKINIGTSKRWFFETSVGANISKRNYYKQTVDYDQNIGEPPLPKDKILFLPRLSLLVGIKLGSQSGFDKIGK